MVLLEDGGAHARKAEAELIDQAGAEDAGPVDARVLAEDSGVAAVTGQRCECVDGIEGIEAVFVRQRVVERDAVVRVGLLIHLDGDQVQRFVDDRSGKIGIGSGQVRADIGGRVEILHTLAARQAIHAG